MFFEKFGNSDVKKFINDNLNSDIARLILKGSPFKNITIQELVKQIEAKKKSKLKLPNWFNNDEIIYPEKLSIEQTSSEITAEFKASLFSGTNAIDLTGGFGVDTYYFSENFKNFTHCEYNTQLSEIVKHNFSVFNKKNVEFVSGDGIEYLKSTNTKYDLIYLDPARRSEIKGKVFLLADTQPNPVDNLELFFSKSDRILIKVSPLLDLKNTVNELKNVKNIYVVSLNNEVKELLFHLEKNYDSQITVQSVDLFSSKKTNIHKFSLDDPNFKSNYSKPEKYLFEPSASIMKTGAFNQISNKFDLLKIAQHSHLYTSDTLIDDFPGRAFEIIATSKANKKEISSILKNGKANISVRNYPLGVAEIRKKFKLKDGGDDYLFFTTDSKKHSLVIYCRKILHTN
ncbi:MAG: class I SAM-dependent methyltransferase [Bacteroidota bacterium]